MKRSFEINRSIINIPVKNSAAECLVRVLVNGRFERFFCVELADEEPDFWCFMDMSEWRGKTVEFEVSEPSGPIPGLEKITLDDSIKEEEKHYLESKRPHFHFTSRRGWLNDPNGLVYFKGEYHLFYQHNPFGIKFANQHWGHAVSRDLVRWTELPTAIAPDQHGFAWSGSGVVDWHNSSGFQTGEEPPVILIYTAADLKQQIFTQCLAFSNDRGRTWTKYTGNPVIPMMKPGNRDPKVIWHEGTGKWIMVLHFGEEYAFLSSKNLKKWEMLHTISLSKCSECPDFFEMRVEGSPERKWVFTAANGTYLVGSFDGRRFVPEQVPMQINGNGNYAVQTFSDMSDGRRVQIAWMTGMRFTNDFSGMEFKGLPFRCNLSFPCELTLRRTVEGLRIRYAPVHEISCLHKTVYTDGDLNLSSDELPVKDPGGPLRIIAVFEAGTASEFGVDMRNVKITYDTKRGVLSASGTGSEIPIGLERGRLHLEILVDSCSIECFINGGLGYLPLSVLSRDMAATGIKVFAARGDASVVSINIASLRSSWNTLKHENYMKELS